MNEIRLQLYLARSGVSARRKCEQYIQEGRVQVNGVTVTVPGTRVGEEDRVTLDGREVRPVTRRVYLALHKPSGYLCANSDPLGRPLASDLFAGRIGTRVFHVGRLDFLSSGLVFFTNDGEFSRAVAHPSSGIEKEYRVETRQEIPEELLERYREGVSVDGERYQLKRYRRRSDRSVHLVLVEGKNREIRRVFDYFGLTITRIHRIRIGIVTIRGIRPGDFRDLAREEVDWFLSGGRGPAADGFDQGRQ
jgi:23S rRNA pseudouridine2605 synthase